MATTTRKTIAGTTAAAAESFGTHPHKRLANLVAITAVLFAMALGNPGEAQATKPAAKSRYRSASHGKSTVGAGKNNGKGNNAEKKAGGVFSAFLPGSRSRSLESESLLGSIPMDRLTESTKQRLEEITDKPTLYRRLPTQAIRCDEEMFLFLTRKPEAIIGIWDLMGITKVKAKRIGPYELDAVDGCGTQCKIDLIYGDQNLHVFVADGMYDGKFTQKPIRGKGLFVFKSSYAKSAEGNTTVTGTLDCFIKFESLGADLIARSLGGLIGNSADHNFTETAKFISQISQASEINPEGMLELVDRMPQVDAKTKAEFARTILNVSQRYAFRVQQSGRLVRERGIVQTRASAEKSRR